MFTWVEKSHNFFPVAWKELGGYNPPMNRYLQQAASELVKEKFLLISGPRQVGKTTLAKQWLADKKGLYLNWDIPSDRERILKLFKQPLPIHGMVLDEIHKYARWKSWLKGLSDREDKHLQVMVTGSARLDLFRRGGDSLLGRYNLVRLHPLTIGELTHSKLMPPPRNSSDWISLGGRSAKRPAWDQLKRRGGFPEPFLKDDDLQHRRWSAQRRQLLVQEEIRDLTDIRHLSLVEHLAILLPERAGSVLSMNSLREELQVAHDTVTSWIGALERIYYCFLLAPYTKRVARSLKKERKLYVWDWSELENPGARFENMVASHLLKAIHAWSDFGYGRFELFYWRDKQKREVDFLITQNRKPAVLIECRLSDEALSPHLVYLGHQLGGRIPHVQLLDKPGVDYAKGNVRIVSADTYLSNLP